MVGLSDNFRKNCVNKIVEDESEEDENDTEWGLEDDFQRNVFDFMIDDEQYQCKLKCSLKNLGFISKVCLLIFSSVLSCKPIEYVSLEKNHISRRL